MPVGFVFVSTEELATAAVVLGKGLASKFVVVAVVAGLAEGDDHELNNEPGLLLLLILLEVEFVVVEGFDVVVPQELNTDPGLALLAEVELFVLEGFEVDVDQEL